MTVRLEGRMGMLANFCVIQVEWSGVTAGETATSEGSLESNRHPRAMGRLVFCKLESTLRLSGMVLHR